MRKILFIICIFFNISIVCAQNLFYGSFEIKTRAETLLSKYSQETDSAQLHRDKMIELSNATNRIDKNITKVIFDVLKAENQMRYTDYVNKGSNAFFKQALIEAEQSEINSLEIWANTRYAYYLYNYRKMQVALPVFLKSIKLCNSRPKDVYIESYETYKKIGYYLITLGQHKEALSFLLKAEKECPKNSPELGALWDNIANNYIKTNNYKEAEKYLQKALTFSKKINDEVRYAKVLGNLAIINDKKGQHQLAIQQLEEDIKISEQHKSDQNSMYALILLSKVYLTINDIDNAEINALKAQKYAISKPYFKSSEYQITEILIKIENKRNNEHEELVLRRKLDDLKEIIKNTDSDETISDVNWIAQKELVENRLNIVKAEGEKESLLKNISYILIFLLLAIFVLIYFLSRRKAKLENQKHQNTLLRMTLDKLLSEKKLDETQKTISTIKTYISEKNNQIEKLETELQNLQKSDSVQHEKIKKELNDLLNSHLITDENWLNLKHTFLNEYPDYFEYLDEDIDDLSDAKFKLVILIKLGLDRKQISQILGISEDTVKYAKQKLHNRLAKKYAVR